MNSEEDILQIYRIAVRNAIASGNSEVVPNSSPGHASIIIEEMLDAAKDSFVAFSGEFGDDVWNAPVIDALRRALRREVKVSLIAMDNADRMPEELKSIISVVNKEKLEKAGQSVKNPHTYHFAVSDGRTVRVEYDLLNRRAAFSANRPDVANALIDEFTKLQGVSESLVA